MSFFRKPALVLALLYSLQDGNTTPVPANDWHAISGNTNAAIIDGDTSSPNYEAISNRSLNLIFSYFDPVTFSDGQTLTLTFEITLEVDATEIELPELRFGLFKSSELKAAAALDDRRVSNDAIAVEGWSGFLFSNSADTLWLYRRNPDETNNYASTNGTDLSMVFSAKIDMHHRTFQSGKPKLFTLVLERAGDDLLISLSQDGDLVEGTFSGAFGEGYQNHFDVFGFYASEGNTVIHKARFSNVNISLNEP